MSLPNVSFRCAAPGQGSHGSFIGTKRHGSTHGLFWEGTSVEQKSWDPCYDCKVGAPTQRIIPFSKYIVSNHGVSLPTGSYSPSK